MPRLTPEHILYQQVMSMEAKANNAYAMGNSVLGDALIGARNVLEQARIDIYVRRINAGVYA